MAKHITDISGEFIIIIVFALAWVELLKCEYNLWVLKALLICMSGVMVFSCNCLNALVHCH